MGLTIHYSFKVHASDARARKLVHALHQTALELPFAELGAVLELAGEQCDVNRHGQDDPLHWLLIQAQQDVEIVSQRRSIRGQVYRAYQWVMPIRLIAFSAWPGEGCEDCNFGLCQFPAVIETTDGPIKTRLSGWRWSSFCKTQYASSPKCGGVPHFLQCHLAVIAILDKARDLGCLEDVSDEGGFWQKRDLPALVKEVGSWNEMLAAFGGKLKDLLGDGQLDVQSEIAQYPNFEQLEAGGQNQLPPGLEKLAKLVRHLGQAVPPAPRVQPGFRQTKTP